MLLELFAVGRACRRRGHDLGDELMALVGALRSRLTGSVDDGLAQTTHQKLEPPRVAGGLRRSHARRARVGAAPGLPV